MEPSYFEAPRCSWLTEDYGQKTLVGNEPLPSVLDLDPNLKDLSKLPADSIKSARD